MLFAVGIALAVRVFLVEPFKIPSASMLPTLLVGDHLFVNKFVFGPRIPFTTWRLWQGSLPERGDVVVFMKPPEGAPNFIKRVVGLPGDVVEVRDHVLYINGERQNAELTGFLEARDGEDSTPAEFGRPHRYRESIGNKVHEIISYGLRPEFGPERVLPDHVFVLGDNRDNSQDSREIGQVPVRFLNGKALFIWYSVAGRSWELWTLRPGRLFHAVH